MPTAPLSIKSVFRLASFLLLTGFCSTSLNAADSNGRFHGMGAGIATCERFLEARASQSNEYFMFGGWLDGYLSARNQNDANTYSLAPWQTIDVLTSFLADYCTKKPDEVFLRAVMVMTEALKPDRLTESSERIGVSIGPFKADYFRATLLRIQQRLNALGYYKGPLNGDFDEATALSLKGFQQSQSIDATGFPDQITLFRLFRE